MKITRNAKLKLTPLPFVWILILWIKAGGSMSHLTPETERRLLEVIAECDIDPAVSTDRDVTDA